MRNGEALTYIWRLHDIDQERYAAIQRRQDLACERRDLIRKLVAQCGWSQQQVADALEISQARVNIILNGRGGKKCAKKY